jgi:hypothetical protein
VTTSASGSERRRHPRHDIRTPIGIDSLTRKDRVGITRNLSESGVLFLTASRFEIGESLNMVLRLRRGIDERVSGTVVRSQRKLGVHDLFTNIVAVEFHEPLSGSLPN